MPRIAHCEFKDGGCDDPRCKRTFCALAAEELEQERALAAAEAEEVRQEAEEMVARAFSLRHHKATDAEVLKAIRRNPEILEMARVRLRERKAALAGIKLDLDL